MIKAWAETRKDKNGIFYRLHLIGNGRYALDTTEEGEADFNRDLSREELKNTRNEIDRVLNHNYGGNNGT